MIDRDLLTREAAEAKRKQLLREAHYYHSRHHHPIEWLSWLALFVAMTIGAGVVAVIILMTFF